jgi:REP element-mobilizing transposase RayT
MRVLRELDALAVEAQHLPHDQQMQRYRQMFRLLENTLHADRRIDYLTRPEIAAACQEAIHDRQRRGIWRMEEYVLMPNHIHLFFELLSDDLKSAMEGFKRWTSREARRRLALKRSLWQQDWFDRWSRSPGQDEDIAEYIRENPVKAGLAASQNDWLLGSWNDEILRKLREASAE